MVAIGIEEYLLGRYPGEWDSIRSFRKFIADVCHTHIELDLADPTFLTNLLHETYEKHWQGLSEALVGNELLAVGLPLTPTRDAPDLLFEHEGRRIWVEVICPEPTGIPPEWLQTKLDDVVKFPHEAVLLRWTAAIKEKAEKLIGTSEKPGYLAKGVVGPEDCYVIAVNGRLLRGPAYATITGISQFPCAVEATLAVGPYGVQIDPVTLEATGGGHVPRYAIKRPDRADVPADTFFDPRFERISAIYACDLDGSRIVGNHKHTAVVYNPNATNPLPVGLLPAEYDYVAEPSGPDEYLLERRPGRVHQEFSTR
jgi:type I restriction enzyme S subunit